MPRMDGSEFLKKYFEMKREKEIPIIAVSSNDMRVKEIMALGAGAFVVKPVTEEKLLEAIRCSHKY